MHNEKPKFFFGLAKYCAQHGLLSGYDRKFLFNIGVCYSAGRALTCRQKNHLSDLMSRLRNQVDFQRIIK